MRASLALALAFSAMMVVGAVECRAQDETAVAGPGDIRTFVRQVYIEGVPYELVRRFDPQTTVPILLEMLANQGEEEHWPNVVVTLGMLGDARAVDPLIRFLEQDFDGTLSHAHYIAKSSVVMALGYLVNRSGNEQALQFLVESVDPDVWTSRGIRWLGPYHKTDLERNRQLTTMSILGTRIDRPPAGCRRPAIVTAGRLLPSGSQVAPCGPECGQRGRRGDKSECRNRGQGTAAYTQRRPASPN
jgi:hypothetical protein